MFGVVVAMHIKSLQTHSHDNGSTLKFRFGQSALVNVHVGDLIGGEGIGVIGGKTGKVMGRPGGRGSGVMTGGRGFVPGGLAISFGGSHSLRASTTELSTQLHLALGSSC